MCLFLQSQDFQRHTENMINNIYGSAQQAEQHLKHITGNLQQFLTIIAGVDSALSDIAAKQQQQQDLIEKSVEGIEQLHSDTKMVQAHLDQVLQNEASCHRLGRKNRTCNC